MKSVFLVTILSVLLVGFVGVSHAVCEDESCSEFKGSEEVTYKSPAAKFIAETIRDNKLTVFSKTFCPHCKRAKAVLGSLVAAKNMRIVELDERDDMSEIQNAMVDVTGARSVPRVFIGGEFIGGADVTVAMMQSGELKAALEAAGIQLK